MLILDKSVSQFSYLKIGMLLHRIAIKMKLKFLIKDLGHYLYTLRARQEFNVIKYHCSLDSPELSPGQRLRCMGFVEQSSI